MSTVVSGELIDDAEVPEMELTYTLKFPDSQVYAEGRRYHFRVTEVIESLRDRGGSLTYTVYLSGPRRRKNGQDSKVKGGELYGLRFTPPLADLPPAVCDYLHGEDRLRRMEGIGGGS